MFVKRLQTRTGDKPFEATNMELCLDWWFTLVLLPQPSGPSIMYLSQDMSVVAQREFQLSKFAFPPLFVCASHLWTVNAFPFFSLHITSVRLRSHADASYCPVVCILSVILLLTVFSFGPSFLCPPQTHQHALTRYISLFFLVPPYYFRHLSSRCHYFTYIDFACYNLPRRSDELNGIIGIQEAGALSFTKFSRGRGPQFLVQESVQRQRR
jgi:hypothetical protein